MENKEEFEKALEQVPCDRAYELCPDIRERFKKMAERVYPGLPPESNQYKEMEMVWHMAYLDFLDILASVVAEQDDDTGADMIEVIRTRAMLFLRDYMKKREEKP